MSGEKAKNSPNVRIKVVGVGGAGGNIITRMGRDFVRGVEFIAINTDAQDLDHCDAKYKIHIGRMATRGMGAGMNPDLGRQAAEENQADISEALKDSDMIFLTAGFGGGTGSGATPVVADIARETGALIVAVVTKPFTFEGSQRMRIAEEGILRLKDKVDAMLVIPNDRIFSVIDNETPILKAFEKIDDILKSAVSGVAEVIASAGLVNVDFADVRAIMVDSGTAVVGVGISEGKERSIKAATQAVNSPLLETSIDGAKGVLFCISGGRDLKMVEISEIAKIITENIDPGAKIIFGAYNDRKLKAGQLKVILIATGFNGLSIKRDDSLSLFSGGDHPKQIVGMNEGRIDVKTDVSTTEKPKKVIPENTKKDDDVWDIPTFLRKRKK
ncbi:MAG: cell division protein FtsZ [Parcubacteria group bacterium CG1_02_42_13]|nr:MAG: cell division protein FtsZ [Parcubacteria group bacterium CG1_02_42_13]